MSRRTLPAAGSVLAVLVVVGLILWARGGDTVVDGRGRTTPSAAPSYTGRVDATTPGGPSATASGVVDPDSGLARQGRAEDHRR